jgi:O-antigen/teichoic acid export membrane protein
MKLRLGRLLTMGVSAFQIVTLAVASEVLLITKFLHKHLHFEFQDTPLLSILVTVFAVNYGVLFFYYLAIYPIFVDPLRKFPGPKVPLPPP